MQRVQQLTGIVRGGDRNSKLLFQAITENNKIDELPGCESEKMKFEDFEANSKGNMKPLAKVHTAL